MKLTDPTRFFKPQWAYETPDGFRDETILIDFKFTVSGTGNPGQSVNLPWQLDDDQPFILRAIFFPQLGIGVDINNNLLTTPGLCRIWDTSGNPLSEGQILSLGAWCGNTIDNAAGAFGFPVEPDVTCSPGGALRFDFQLSTNARPAQAIVNGAGASLIFLRNIFGTAGNDLTSIELIDPGAPNIPLSVAVVAPRHVQVTLATDGASAITSTFPDVAAIINGDAAAGALIFAIAQGSTTEVITAHGQTNLVGGAAAEDIEVRGTLIGVKRFPECL